MRADSLPPGAWRITPPGPQPSGHLGPPVSNHQSGSGEVLDVGCKLSGHSGVCTGMGQREAHSS